MQFAVFKATGSRCGRPFTADAPVSVTRRPVHPRSRGGATVVTQAGVTALPASLDTIVRSFQAVPDPMARYKQLLHYASLLKPLPAEQHIPENKVRGCVSQVWLVGQMQADGTLSWAADSDSQLTKGLAALLVSGLTGATPEEIVKVSPDFITSLGFQQALTPSRNNGFLNMFKLMQRKALEMIVSKGGAARVEPASSTADAVTAVKPASGHHDSEASAQVVTGPISHAIQEKLTLGLQPARLDVVNDSAKHAGHAFEKEGTAALGESHFSVRVVASKFEGLSMLKRHRMVYSLLKDEMAGAIHALQLETLTPQEAGNNGRSA